MGFFGLGCYATRARFSGEVWPRCAQPARRGDEFLNACQMHTVREIGKERREGGGVSAKPLARPRLRGRRVRRTSSTVNYRLNSESRQQRVSITTKMTPRQAGQRSQPKSLCGCTLRQEPAPRRCILATHATPRKTRQNWRYTTNLGQIRTLPNTHHHPDQRLILPPPSRPTTRVTAFARSRSRRWPAL